MGKKELENRLLEDQDENIQTFIESRSAQKLFDEFFVEVFWDKAKEFLAYPESLRTMDDEEQVEVLMDYALGRFLDEYGSGYIREARSRRRRFA